MIDDIFAKLKDESSTFSLNESFELSRVCAEYLNAEDEVKNEVARKILIHVLDRWSSFPNETQPLWTDLVEAAGFYPYLYRHDNDMKLTSLSDEVRANSHLSVKPSENAVFSRHFAYLVFQPYVFSLVFALTSRNKGKFFTLRRPPYPAVLRKYASLPL